MRGNTRDNAEIIKHQANVVNAVNSYCNASVTLSVLANTFCVSENTISGWFCEAVEKRYVASDAVCHQVMSKHIAEYETKHALTNSSLRRQYNDAFSARALATA